MHKKWCLNWREFVEMQMKALRAAIDENKWYLSEKAGHDVGWDVAQRDFLEKYLVAFAADFRLEYCKSHCPNRDVCPAITRFKELNDNWSGCVDMFRCSADI